MILRGNGVWIMEQFRNHATNLYTFQDAKKIYFAKTPSKYYLIEKKTSSPSTRVLSLFARKTVLISKENGILLFPKS